MSENPSVSSLAERAGKYLDFELGNEIYGVELCKVKEIIGMMRVTHVPNTPNYVRGVINLRGKVIPVLDLRTKFGMESKEDSERTCIVVIQVSEGDRLVITGIIVDEVSEVVDINASQMEPPPNLGAGVNTEIILGVGKIGQKVVLLLDIEKVIATTESIKIAEQLASVA